VDKRASHKHRFAKKANQMTSRETVKNILLQGKLKKIQCAREAKARKKREQQLKESDGEVSLEGEKMELLTAATTNSSESSAKEENARGKMQNNQWHWKEGILYQQQAKRKHHQQQQN
jgi:hypothetical protein